MPPDKLVRLSEEQTTMLLAATGVDSKYVVVVVSCEYKHTSPPPLPLPHRSLLTLPHVVTDAGLSVLHTTVHEAATVHFLEAAARALGVLSQGKPPAVVCAKQHIKVVVWGLCGGGLWCVCVWGGGYSFFFFFGRMICLQMLCDHQHTPLHCTHTHLHPTTQPHTPTHTCPHPHLPTHTHTDPHTHRPTRTPTHTHTGRCIC